MTNHRLTLAEVAGDITRMYKAIGGERAINEAIRAQNLLGRRLSLLIDLESSKLGPDDLDDVSALTLQEAFLDAVALQIAAGGRSNLFTSFDVVAPSLLGGARARRAKIGELDQTQLDWHFQVLVQAWAAGRSNAPVKELELDSRFQGLKSCDFAVERAERRIELLECKRFHPVQVGTATQIDAAIAKLCDRLPDAIDQLQTTSQVLGVANCDTHLH